MRKSAKFILTWVCGMMLILFGICIGLIHIMRKYGIRRYDVKILRRHHKTISENENM